MKLEIRTRHIVMTPEALAEAHRRVTVSLARISPWIRSVDIRLADINGPKGGADKLCRVRIRGRSMPSVVVEHVGTDVLAALAFAVERAEQTIVRKMARRRSFAPLLAF